MATLTLQNLTKHFPGGVRAVDGLSIDVHDSELLVVAGPSGCGKTTTLRMIAGLERPTAGRIAIDGREVNGMSPRDRNVAMVCQHHALYPHLSVAGNLRFGLKLRGIVAAEIDHRVAWAADMLGIAGLLDRRPGDLSGGQQQRVALGRAIVRQPSLFLMDEPLSNLDPALRCELRTEIRRLQAELGTTTVYVTHDQAEAMTLGHRIAVMHQGRLQQCADPATIYERPANRIVAAMFGSPGMNFLEGRIEWADDEPVFVGEAHRTASHGDVDAAFMVRLTPPADVQREKLGCCAGNPITLGVRPEHIRPVGERSPDAVSIPAKVERIERLGAESHVQLRVGGQALVMRTDRASCLNIGDRIDIAVATPNIHFFDAQDENGPRLP